MNFYTIVLIIAVVLLIVGLIIVKYILSESGSSNPYPDYQNLCPDFWNVRGTDCFPPISGMNTPSPDKFKGTAPSIQHTGVNITNNKLIKLNTSSAFWSGLCDQSSWAKTNGIFWDGVANTNQCT